MTDPTTISGWEAEARAGRLALHDLRAELAAERARSERLWHLLAMVTLDKMGGTPDLFEPAGVLHNAAAKARAVLAENPTHEIEKETK